MNRPALVGKKGRVWLVGAGPGDPGLLTVRGREVLRRAHVVLYDRLVGQEILSWTHRDAQLIQVGKRPGGPSWSQEEIQALMVERALAGLDVVRLKGGDPFVFGRGVEEREACHAAGIRCQVVSGVSSALAVPAAAGIPVTHRGLGRSFAVLTGQVAAGEGEGDGAVPDYRALAGLDTVVLLMGWKKLTRHAASLILAGRDPNTPAACIASGTTDQQKVVRAPLRRIATVAQEAGLQAPVVTVIGDVAGLGEAADSSLALLDALPDLPSPSATASDQGSLSGRRVAVTQAVATSGRLVRLLREAGAEVVHCPLTEICEPSPSLEAARPSLVELLQGSEHDGAQALDVDWLVFTSAHGVHGFWRQLAEAGLDTRALGGCQVAALGEGSQRALSRRGVEADLVPDQPRARSLAISLLERLRFQGGPRGLRILHPQGSRTQEIFREIVTREGAEVVDLVVYQAQPLALAASTRQRLLSVDAVAFCSPTAAEAAAMAGVSFDRENILVGCIGPLTAAAARNAGVEPDVVADRPGTAGLVAALTEALSRPGSHRQEAALG